MRSEIKFAVLILFITTVAVSNFAGKYFWGKNFTEHEIKNQFYQNHLKTFSRLFDEDYVTVNQKKTDILHYDLYFNLYPEEKLLKGIAKIKGTLRSNDVNSIDLNFYDNMVIKELKLNGISVNYEFSDNLISVPFQGSRADTFLIEIKYEGTPKRGGFVGFAFGEINYESLVYTLSEPNYSSTWFPCNDFPSDKALLDMKIENDSSKVSVSNGILTNVELKDGRKIYHWKTLYPISTYLITLYSSAYKNFSEQYISLDKKDTMSIEYYVLPKRFENAKIDFEGHPRYIKVLAKMFGEYPFIKEKYGIAEFLWQMGAMEHQTITGVATNLIGGKKFFRDVYIHELAHHWWGDAISPKSWNDIWLNEGFASYSEALYFEAVYGKTALESSMKEKQADHFLGILGKPGNNLFTNTVYDKGAWVLHMLRWEVGDSTFFKILRSYYQKYKYSNASIDDFKNVCEEISGKNLDKFFEQWIYSEGDIEIEYAWDTEKTGEDYTTHLFINQIQDEYREYHFPLEVQLVYDSHSSETFKFYVDDKQKDFFIETKIEPEKIIIDPNSWMLLFATEVELVED